jgi:hypothetical protein
LFYCGARCFYIYPLRECDLQQSGY